MKSAVSSLPGSGGMSAVAARVLAGLEGLLETLGRSYAEVPEYGALDAAVMANEVLPTSRRIVSAFFLPLTTGDEPDPSSLTELPRMGRRRQDMGMPLEPLLHVYRICGRVVWDAIVSATEPGEEGVLAEMGARWMDYIDRASSLAAAGYLAASHERLRTVDARRRALLEELLAADDPAELAAVSIRFSTVLAAAYTPVLMEGDHAHSRIDLILAAAPDGTIGGYRAGRTLLLIPSPRADLSAVFHAAGPSLITWSEQAAPGSPLLHQVGRTELLMQAARASGAKSGVFGPQDLLIEQLLVGNPSVTAALHARVLDALAGRDHDGLITSTLRSYLETGSVSATATSEVVHANTVLYRLNRVKALTGLDPRKPADATVLTLALRSHGGRP